MINSTLKNANILIVDDQQQNIDVLTGLLDMTGYINYITTTDPRKVADLFVSFKPHLILLDLMMPHLNGFQVMEQLKALIPTNTFLPILVLTADAKTETKQQALANGATDFLIKPFDLIEVELRIRNLLKALYLHQQLEDQNLILEEKVKERTAVLEQTNIELIAAKDKAEENDRLKSAFLANISHEIRTPMNGILGFCELLQEPNLTGAKQQMYIGIIEKSGVRMLNTIHNIMNISKIEAGIVEKIVSETNVNDLMEELYDFFQPEVEKKKLQLFLKNNLTVEERILETDREKLHTILTNLIKNSIKFTQAGTIEFGCTKKDDNVEFFVKDTGVGIPQEHEEFIFERFRQGSDSLTRNYEGSGLGLPIAKAYVEILDGAIWLESEVGKGTVFYFTIPHHKEEKEKRHLENPTEVTENTYQIKKLKILIVEDDEISDLLLSTLLDEINPEILHAKTGIEAIAACRTNPDIDLILMDIKMSEMNGYEATRQIRQFNEEVIIIAQSAYAFSTEGDKAIKEGQCNAYISKPIIKDELMKLIHSFFHK
ncbi:MAG: response regulator [Flavobacteriaceae bacterium]|nr:response regulator [Flavobacteriaceae bacterium]